MSNTSYSFKENSHMKEFQGGEKKVMKKILSVALSTAMAFSMFASVAFSAEKLTPQQQFDALKTAGVVNGYPDQSSGLERTITRAELATIIVKAIDLDPVVGVATYKDPNYTAGHWAAKYIEAATQAGILTGKDAVKQLFGPNDNLTVQELAVVLVKALKLEVPAETNNTATEWAKGYVQAAINEGLIESGINYQANATRSQAIVAAYAIWESNQIPTVASYEVSEAGKVVEFKLSNDDVVKVTLEEALAPNKETEVKFTHNGNEYTHKVTYVTTVAQTVQSVKAENLKQIVVTFDGTLDPETAGNEDNYVVKDRSFHSATLSEDKSSVTLLLDNEAAGNYMTNQKEIELEIKGVRNEDGTKTFNQTVKFTPSDVTAPTVQEVTGLGTKAFKIKFSEPIDPATALTSSSYKVDGKAIGAFVKFGFPDTVIVQTSLPVGEHTVTVSGVADFSGLKVAPVDNQFTVTEDTAAPEVASVKTKDLKEVIVEFNESIKAVSEAYANTTSNKATRIVIEDTKVRLFFNSPLNYSENTVTLRGVSDYSDNKADRDVKVTPTLDTVRPVVSESELKLNSNGHYIAKIRFSKELDPKSAKDTDNYVLKNADGKIPDLAGIDKDGHPQLKPEFENSSNRVVLVDLGTSLKSEKYTLTITGVKDTAYVGNVLAPTTIDLDVSKAQNGAIDRVWYGDADSGHKYVYVEFNKELATSGDGNPKSAAKYTLLKKAKNGTGGYVTVGQLTENNDDIDLLTSKSVRIKTKHTTFEDANYTYAVKASYVANAEGKFLQQNGSYELIQDFADDKYITIKSGSVKATSRTEVEVEFNSRISNVSDSDFYINDARPQRVSLSSDGKKLTFTLDDDHKLPATVGGATFKTVAQTAIGTSNEYGVKIKEVEVGIKDEIKPELLKDGLKVARVNPSATTATYEIGLALTEAVEFNPDWAGSSPQQVYNLFEIEAKQGQNITYKGTVTGIKYVPADAVYNNLTGIVLTVEFELNGNDVADLGNSANTTLHVKIKDSNEQSKLIVDKTGNKNPLKAGSVSNYFSNIGTLN
ncbi:S-layer homology domain-containing protein [Paenibacillus fonticola]|uniref:S-layer homology domain-containing protein n=1 Tax=Paenibacillus fonticola TaxID=379896 RepID=UPI00037568C4|nr:S-layer homology domain-containing protein [Paenibacillus fonticola]